MTDILQVNDYLINTADFIGKGGYGVVYGCESKSLKNIKLCAKIIQALADDGYLQREITILQKIKQMNEKHLVKIYDVISQYNQTFVIMERCDVGDLKFLIDQYKRMSKQFSLEEIWDFLAQIIQGYKVLYENKMIHRDLKPANILLSYDDKNKLILKLTDFSLGKVLLDLEKKQFLTKAGTPGYASPQIYIGGEFSSKCDVFSLGVILYQIIYFKLPFSSRSLQEMIEKLKNLSKNKIQYSNFPQGVGCNELQQLISRMLEFEEDDRISWEELFKLKITGQSNITKSLIDQQQLQNSLQQTIQIYYEYQGEMLYFQEQKFNDIVKLTPQNLKNDQDKIKFLVIHLLTQAQFVFSLTQCLQDILQKYFPKFEIYHFELIQTTIIGYRCKLLTNAYGFCSNNYKLICEEFRQLFGKENLQKLFQQNQQQQKDLILFIEEFWNQTQDVFLVAENNIIQLMKTNKYPRDITNFTKLMSVVDNTEYKIYGKWFEFFWKRHLQSLLILDNTLNSKIEYLQLLALIEKFLNLNVEFSLDKIFQSNPQNLILDKKITKQQLELMVKQRKNV